MNELLLNTVFSALWAVLNSLALKNLVYVSGVVREADFCENCVSI